MRVIHEIPITSRCPVNNGHDSYVCTIETNRLVNVEDIIAAITELTKEPAFQEDLTVRLSHRLDCKVTTVGWHSGVKTTATAGEDDVYERGRR